MKPTPFALDYDRATDVLYLTLDPSAVISHTVEGPTGVLVDVARSGHMVAIEIMDASLRFSAALLAQVAEPKGEEISLAEAARDSGLSPATLRVQLNAGRLNGRKRGRDWVVERHELWNYLESRAPQGRPAARRKARRRSVRR